MRYNKDGNLTKNQSNAKYALYCDMEFMPNSDIRAVLESILKDID